MKLFSYLYKVQIHLATKLRTFFLSLRLHDTGEAVEIGAACKFSTPKLVSIGHHVFVNFGCIFFTHIFPLKVGNYVLIGPHCTFLTSNLNFSDWTKPMYLDISFHGAPITIEDDVWIGANVTVLPGVTVGRGSIVGAGSVVTHDVEPYSIVVGNPARLSRYRFEEKIRAKAANINLEESRIPYNRTNLLLRRSNV